MTCRRRAERSVLLVLVVAATYLMYSQHVFSNIIFDVPDTYTPNAGGVCMGSKWPGAVLPLYVITPTYPRAEQLPEITRLGQTLLHVHSLVWVVVEDADWPTESLVRFLEELGICHVYLRARMPKKFRDWNYNLQPRGVANRLKALEWITQNAKFGGTIYFADDDNTYDLRLFEEIRRTKKVSVFPVGLVGELGVSAPIVRGGKVVGFYDGYSERKFAVDFAGFAVNVNLLNSRQNDDKTSDDLQDLRPIYKMPFVQGLEETEFLESLAVTLDDLEPLAGNATKVLVWHTQTRRNKEPGRHFHDSSYSDSNIEVILQLL